MTDKFKEWRDLAERAVAADGTEDIATMFSFYMDAGRPQTVLRILDVLDASASALKNVREVFDSEKMQKDWPFTDAAVFDALAKIADLRGGK